MKKVDGVQKVDVDFTIGNKRVQISGEIISRDGNFVWVLDPVQGYVELPAELVKVRNLSS